MSEYKTYLEVVIVVDYDYQPAEKQVLYPNDEAYPGCDANVTINSVAIDGLPDADISPYIAERDLKEIESEILDIVTQSTEI